MQGIHHVSVSATFITEALKGCTQVLGVPSFYSKIGFYETREMYTYTHVEMQILSVSSFSSIKMIDLF